MTTEERKYGRPNPQQEAEWAAHREECYSRWRADKIAKARAWLAGATGLDDRRRRLDQIGKKYGPRFVRDLTE